MHELAFLRDTVILLAAAVVFVFAFQRMRASPVLGYLVGGVPIGPHALGLIDEIEATRSLAELGVVFLMFSIGLELSFKRLSTLRGGIFGLGTAQVLLTGLIIGAAAWLIGVGVTASIVIGSGIALSSTAVVLQLLAERGELASRVGRTSFSILLLQDVAVVPLIAMVPLLAAEQVTDLEAVGLGIVTAVAALAAIVVAGRLILRPVFRAIAGLRGSEVFVAITLLAVLGTGWAAEQAGLSLTLGAFLAGLLLA
ncbi:MAG: cation:proton antiporter, partial [Pseudomonadota bacterium]